MFLGYEGTKNQKEVNDELKGQMEPSFYPRKRSESEVPEDQEERRYVTIPRREDRTRNGPTIIFVVSKGKTVLVTSQEGEIE